MYLLQVDSAPCLHSRTCHLGFLHWASLHFRSVLWIYFPTWQAKHQRYISQCHNKVVNWEELFQAPLVAEVNVSFVFIIYYYYYYLLFKPLIAEGKRQQFVWPDTSESKSVCSFCKLPQWGSSFRWELPQRLSWACTCSYMWKQETPPHITAWSGHDCQSDRVEGVSKIRRL